jgi:hypothetical protein
LKPDIVGYFKSHPILLLLVLTPGIPEYLSGSSALNGIILNPGWFVFGLAANLGMYGPGVLLIREAKVRWQKGWATVLALGAAYGILEEGIALSTLFDPTDSAVGKFGVYGHWLGVNWIWTAGILSVHMLFSISLPILLLGLALPETNGKSLLKSDRSVASTLCILAADIFILFMLIRFDFHFTMSLYLLAGGLAAIAGLTYLAWKLPANALTPRSLAPTKSPIWMGVLGATFYPSILIFENWGKGAHLPASIDLVLVVADQALYLALVLRTIGRSNNERNLTAFVAGLITPIGLFGFVSELALPLSLIVIIIAIVLLRMLWKKYPKSAEVGLEKTEVHLLQ